MKKATTSLIILFLCFNLFGQENEEKNSFKNQFGLEVSDLINGAYQFKYERILGEHTSLSLGIAYKGENGIIRLSGLDTEQIKTGEIAYSGFKIIPEFRYYLKKTSQYGMDGFYFGAYLKYSNYQSDLDGTYINDADESFTIAFDADIKVVSVGLMVGYKLPLSERFSIDFLIAGPGAGRYDFSFVNKEDLPDEFYDDFNEALENYSLFDLLDGEFRFKETDSNSKFTLPSFRYGISLGYSF
ncbi:hypothetical protein A9Q87_01385 [Flavobacteriales bacterium 34_180_T64]|nr:hypothetical protein A9Q87_01385 [Flavobacteriales bacterium 34_180_T64]